MAFRQPLSSSYEEEPRREVQPHPGRKGEALRTGWAAELLKQMVLDWSGAGERLNLRHRFDSWPDESGREDLARAFATLVFIHCPIGARH